MVACRQQRMPFWLSLSTAGAFVNIDIEAGINKLISYSLYNFFTEPFNGGLVQPLLKRLPEVGYVRRQ